MKMMIHDPHPDEHTHLLEGREEDDESGGDHHTFSAKTTTAVDSSQNVDDSSKRSILQPLLGLLVGMVMGFLLAGGTINARHHHLSASSSSSFLRLDALIPKNADNNPPPTNSKYTKFQALNFQIYTGGAPVEITTQSSQDGGDMNNMTNPECQGLKNIGSVEGVDQCYLGHAHNTTQDVADRLAIMRDAVERAYLHASSDPSVLKVFVAPEFFFRGPNGAYLIDKRHRQAKGGGPVFRNDANGQCQEEICHILQGLEEMIADARFQDWIFLFGTAVLAEVLPTADHYDYLFYNFGLLYKGYDPTHETHLGKRFLVPKRYVSTSDFLSPTDTEERMKNSKELYETAQYEQDDNNEYLSKSNRSSLVVPLRKKYDHDLWYKYKQELEKLEYTMIEYGWLQMDGVTLTVEICLDHDMRRALQSFLADTVLPQPTLIPSSHKGVVNHVEIPRHQAQISLVASAGMTVSETSLALADQGSIVLQDGLENGEPDMMWTYECFTYRWEFLGGSEVIRRNATMTPTEVVFHYDIHRSYQRVLLYDNNNSQDDDHLNVADWRTHLRGVFTGAQYPPLVKVYDPVNIAKVGF
eukprot:scaffold1475_cov167-Amphora_coffeaeformis.AAC.4